MRLSDKVMVITGAASGIGRATAVLCAQEGARLVLGDVNEGDGEQGAASLRESGSDAVFVGTDVTSSSDVARLVETAVDRHGRLDIMFNNAGVSMGGSILDRSEEDFDLVIAVNLKGTFLGCKHALPHLLDNPNGGVILNMSSNGGLIGRPADPLYVATKHGIMGLTKSLALAYTDRRIRVNALCPGPIDTPMIWSHQPSDMDAETYLRRAVASCPTPRMASPGEVARAAVFLVSDDASFVNGVGLAVDGAKAAGVFNLDRYRLDFALI
jgi:NAD(P)-dependent dehydrogenase (short-subunit alcohol dehydrogenase family)